MNDSDSGKTNKIVLIQSQNKKHIFKHSKLMQKNFICYGNFYQFCYHSQKFTRN